MPTETRNAESRRKERASERATERGKGKSSTMKTIRFNFWLRKINSEWNAACVQFIKNFACSNIDIFSDYYYYYNLVLKYLIMWNGILCEKFSFVWLKTHCIWAVSMEFIKMFMDASRYMEIYHNFYWFIMNWIIFSFYISFKKNILISFVVDFHDWVMYFYIVFSNENIKCKYKFMYSSLIHFRICGKSILSFHFFVCPTRTKMGSFFGFLKWEIKLTYSFCNANADEQMKKLIRYAYIYLA